MKKRNIINLIRYHAEKNNAAFRSEALEIAKDFESSGDSQLAQYVMAIISGTHLFSPQNDSSEEFNGTFFDPIQSKNLDPLPLPTPISDDIKGIATAVRQQRGLHKFLFQGAPGTGKTQTCLQLARILERTPLSVNFSRLIDSRLGQTQKNVEEVFHEMCTAKDPSQFVFLLDEIDAIALDRTNIQDSREMGRVTSAFLKALDELPETVLLVATTNLFPKMDSALTRRFDFIVDFNRYSQADLSEIAEHLLDFYLRRYGCPGRKNDLFRKILRIKPLPMPAEIKNRIRLATAFSSCDESLSYMPHLYKAFTGKAPDDSSRLRAEGFTLRDIEILMNVSRSTLSRKLRNLKE